ENWPASAPGWSADGRALAVVGFPVSHSLSPAMHNAALAQLAVTSPQKKFSHWHYFKFEIKPERLGDALALFFEKGFCGLNLTVPHKTVAMQFIDSALPLVEDIGAANTLKRTATRWQGNNTDGHGLAAALQADLHVTLSDANVILLGAGGAARAAAVQCLLDRCRSLWIGNRTQSTLGKLIADLKKTKACSPATDLQGFDPKDDHSLSRLPAQSIVINATSLGLKLEDDSPLDLAKISRPSHVFDMIYRPAQTALLRQAATLGIPNANGLSMLVHQGAASLEIWTGEKAPIATMDQAVRRAIL
ncbi:MAG: shikimate dehydrogenase, partial [Lacunisphaera sp.]